MKKILSLVLVIALTAPAAMAQLHRAKSASHDDNYHFGYVSGGVGYNTLIINDSRVSSTGSVGGMIGIGYEFRLNGFWLSVGPQLSFSNSTLTIEPTIWKPGEDSRFAGQTFYDDQGKVIYPQYQIEQNDAIRWSFIDVPILLGYYNHGFYVGAGGKFSYAINSNTKSTGNYSFFAKYELYGENSPGPEIGHGYLPQREYSTKEEKINTLPYIALIGEVGYDVLSEVEQRGRINHVLKVGFYFEYGLSTMIKESATDKRFEYTLQDEKGNYDLRYPTIHPYFQGTMQGKRVVPFYTGLKVTYLIGGSRTARSGYHKGCQCYN